MRAKFNLFLIAAIGCALAAVPRADALNVAAPYVGDLPYDPTFAGSGQLVLPPVSGLKYQDANCALSADGTLLVLGAESRRTFENEHDWTHDVRSIARISVERPAIAPSIWRTVGRRKHLELVESIFDPIGRVYDIYDVFDPSKGESTGKVIRRVLPNAHLDRSFGRGGEVHTGRGTGDMVDAFTTPGNGIALVAADGHRGPEMIVYDRRGRLDRKFSGDGKLELGSNVWFVSADRTGYYAFSSGRRLSVRRLDRNGRLVTRFGTRGRTVLVRSTAGAFVRAAKTATDGTMGVVLSRSLMGGGEPFSESIISVDPSGHVSESPDLAERYYGDGGFPWIDSSSITHTPKGWVYWTAMGGYYANGLNFAGVSIWVPGSETVSGGGLYTMKGPFIASSTATDKRGEFMYVCGSDLDARRIAVRRIRL